MEQLNNAIEFKDPFIIGKKLLELRNVYLWGPVEDANSRKIIEQMVYLDAVDPGNPIHFYINSPGGMVTAGYAIYDVMQSVQSPVHTYCLGFAASMGSTLLSAGQKGCRFIYPRAEVMIHQPSMGSFQANSADIEINARQIAKAKDITASLLAANCGQSKEKVLSDFDRDYWMNATEAVAYGIVDRII